MVCDPGLPADGSNTADVCPHRAGDFTWTDGGAQATLPGTRPLPHDPLQHACHRHEHRSRYRRHGRCRQFDFSSDRRIVV